LADLKIYKILGLTSSTETPFLRSAGLENIALRILKESVQEVTALGVNSIRSYAPIKYGELRESVLVESEGELQNSIRIPESSHSAEGPLSEPGAGVPGVSVRRKTPNIGRRGGIGVRISNALLAQILEDGVKRGSPAEHTDVIRPRLRVAYRQQPGKGLLKRSQESHAIPPFAKQSGLTQAWITNAQRDFLDEIRK